MKTDELISMLAASGGAVEPGSARRRFSAAIGWGALGAALLMAVMLGLRPDLADAVTRPMFWVKVGYALCLALASLYALSRLARPGLRLSGAPLLLAAPVAFIWILAAIALSDANPAERRQMFLGSTWNSCPTLIATLSIPAFGAMVWAVRGLAPTRLRLAGGAVGLVASGIGAVAYSLHCPEMSASFLGSWYLIGMLIPTVVGVLVGPRLLRW